MTTLRTHVHDEQIQPRMWRRPAAFDVLRIVLGLILLTAAILKGWQLATEPTLEKGLLTSRWFLILGVEVEWLLAVWLLSGMYKRAAWWVTLGSFVLFACIALHKALSGEVTCGCFGQVQVNPWYTVILDLGCVSLLFLCCQRQASACSARGDITWLWPALLCSGLVSVGLAGGVAMGIYTPTRVDRANQLLGRSTSVVLEPARWGGELFPLLEYIDIGHELEAGRWLIVLYRHDCLHCQEEMPEYERLAEDIRASAQPARVMFVELPPYSENLHHQSERRGPYLVGHLAQTKTWFVTTPTAVLLKDQRVLQVMEDAAAGIVAQWPALWSS